MQEILLKIRYFEKGSSKGLKKLYFFFRTPSHLMDKIIKNKRDMELVTSCSSDYKTSWEKFLYWLCIISSIFWCYIKQFLSYSKNYICKFMQSSSWDHKLFHFHLCFWIWEMWKGRVKITKIWISEELKELFQWNRKYFFIVFEGLSFGEKIKIWLKVADTSFKGLLWQNSEYFLKNCIYEKLGISEVK